MEMKEKTDGNWCLALEMEKDTVDEEEQVAVFPGLIHVKNGLAPSGEGSESSTAGCLDSITTKNINASADHFCIIITLINLS